MLYIEYLQKWIILNFFWKENKPYVYQIFLLKIA